ncbi:MAG: hypothetical protein J7K22_04195 [Nanoarchaeota archaeon]|nr:hypothetical protein [Nanoarchaeota archaeon]
MSTASQEISSVSIDPFWKEIDITKSRIYPSKLPDGIYLPTQVVDIANAYRNKEKYADYKKVEDAKERSEKENAYKANLKIIENFEKRIKSLEEMLENPEIENKEEIRKSLLYMESFQSRALTLSRQIAEIEKHYEEKEQMENERYKKKLKKLERDKEKRKKYVKTEQRILQRIGFAIGEFLVPVITYLFTEDIITNEIERVLISIATVLPSFGIGEYLLGRIKDLRIKKVVEEFEPLFQQADKEHYDNLQRIRNDKKRELKNKYYRKIGELVEELYRYFPDAVELVKINQIEIEVTQPSNPKSSSLL